MAQISESHGRRTLSEWSDAPLTTYRDSPPRHTITVSLMLRPCLWQVTRGRMAISLRRPKLHGRRRSARGSRNEPEDYRRPRRLRSENPAQDRRRSRRRGSRRGRRRRRRADRRAIDDQHRHRRHRGDGAGTTVTGAHFPFCVVRPMFRSDPHRPVWRDKSD